MQRVRNYQLVNIGCKVLLGIKNFVHGLFDVSADTSGQKGVLILIPLYRLICKNTTVSFKASTELKWELNVMTMRRQFREYSFKAQNILPLTNEYLDVSSLDFRKRTCNENLQQRIAIICEV